MNIALDPSEWSVACLEGGAREDCTHPDWHDLMARFNAAFEARCAFEDARRSGAARAFGSFSPRTAVSLERITGTFGPVNQTGSVNRKRARCTILDVADENKIGGRG
jgi:hypothetical protein